MLAKKNFNLKLVKDKINIASIAEYYGGGHYDVAGCKIPNNWKSIQELLTRAKKILSRRR